MEASTSDWCSLPETVLNLITKFLDTRIDILRFRAVCSSFRSSTPLPLKILFPDVCLVPQHLKIPVPIELHLSDGDYFLLFEKSIVYAIQPLNDTKTWLLKVEESCSGEMDVLDLFGRFYLGDYRSSGNMLPPKSLNLLDYRVKKISTEYLLKLVTDYEYYESEEYDYFSKVVVSKSSDLVKIDDEFAVMATNREKKNLIVWRNGDKNWVNIGFGEPNSLVQDIIYQEEKFYAVNGYGDLVVIVDSMSLNVTKVVVQKPNDCNGFYNRMFVKSLKDLFLVDSQSLIGRFWSGDAEYRTTDLNIYMLHETTCDMVKQIDELEDRVFFVGDDCSFSISAEEYSECKENCFYASFDEMFAKVKADHSDSNEALEIDFYLEYDMIDETLQYRQFYAILIFSSF